MNKKKKKKNIKAKHHLYRRQRNKHKQDPRPELTYTLPNIPLAAPSAHEHALYREHKALHDLKNTLIHHAIAQLENLERNRRYQHAKRTIAVLGKELAAEKKKKPKNRDAHKVTRLERHIADAKAYTREALNTLGLDKNSFEKRLNVQRKQQYAKIVGSDAGQKVADTVWRGVEDVLYGKGEHLHYEKRDDSHAISGKSTHSGINLYRENGKPAGIIYRKRFIPFKRALNAYETEALTTGALRYVEVYPIRFSDGYHWYARFVLHGKVPPKGRMLSRKRGGLDVGTSTAAFASATLTEMRVLGGEPKDYDERIAELSRRIDASMRATNPGYYNADGTIKKRKRGEDGTLVERSWKLSAHCKAMKAKRKLLYRKKAVTLQQSHCELANLIASHAGIVCTETMNWAGLAKRAKRARDEKTGREKSRKRYGKSIGSHAPAAFVDALAWRLLTLGGKLEFVDTYSFRASQLDHFTGECAKVKLSQRWKEVAGERVQRDLYSAFLLWHADASLAHADVTWCELDFPRFVARQGEFLSRARESGLYRNSCFGF